MATPNLGDVATVQTRAKQETSTIGISAAIDQIGFGRFQLFLSFAVGFAFVADAMEMMILSILGPALRCTEWRITQYDQALLTTVVFLGMMLGAPLWGVMADKYGRRPILIWATFFLFWYGTLTSASPSFVWVLLLRFFVGVFIGAVPQSYTLLVEYLPSQKRGKAVLIMALFWALGCLFMALLAWLVMYDYGWRMLIGLSSTPLLVFVMFAYWLPESPLYLATVGRQKEMEMQIRRVSQVNHKSDLFTDIKIIHDVQEIDIKNRGRFADLFQDGRKKLTAFIWVLWFVSALGYYGVVLMSTELLNSSKDYCGHSKPSDNEKTFRDLVNNASSSSESCSLQCDGLTTQDYETLIWTTLAEFPGVILAMCLIDPIGRRNTLKILFGMFTISILLMLGCSISKSYLLVMLFIGRGAMAGVFQVVYLYTPEVYPTNLRAVAYGSASAIARIGAMITPYIAQVLVDYSLFSAIAVYAVMGVVALIVSFLLPIESKGLDLSETGHQMTKGRMHLVNTNEEEDDYGTIDANSKNDSTSNIPERY